MSCYHTITKVPVATSLANKPLASMVGLEIQRKNGP
jgi:hypothetical protein